MFADERRADIVMLVNAQKTVTVSELTGRYRVSIETIRRDLELLERDNLIRRVHGGAVSPGRMQQFEKLSERAKQHLPEKVETARAVISLLKEGDHVMLDSGTTAREIAQLMAETFQHLTVISYSMEVMQTLSRKEGFRLIQIGGEYLGSEQVFCGYMAQEMLRGLHAGKAILCPSAVSVADGIYDYIPELIPNQKLLTECADEVIVAADAAKLGQAAPYRIAELTPAMVIATDSGVSSGFVRDCRAKGVRVCPVNNKGGKEYEKQSNSDIG